MRNKLKVGFFFVLVVIFSIVAYLGRKSLYNRVRNSAITTGVITKIDHAAKTNYYVAYTFLVDGKEYFGSVPIKFCKECQNQCCTIGAKVKVRYEKNNPNNNDLIH